MMVPSPSRRFEPALGLAHAARLRRAAGIETSRIAAEADQLFVNIEIGDKIASKNMDEENFSSHGPVAFGDCCDG